MGEWSMWANEQAFLSGILMVMGGIVGLFDFDGFGFAVYTLAAGVFIVVLEYPRGIRKKGSTVQRKFQHILHPVMCRLEPVSTNYFVRFVFYLLISIPCIFQLPTILGGVSIFVAGLIYLKAALGGESWACQTKSNVTRAKTRTNRPPEAPPPRPPAQTGQNNGGFADIQLEAANGH
ncbi:cytochrome b-245 light chain-like [Amphiura filiformis]|uniref:cytochrome b-245 light chain-like n=1 Tax=Amphiura filiformis TaxID=82378 RepID=UPI003B224793